MGVMENMLHSKSLTMVTSTNNSNNDERFGKPSMENGHCIVLTQLNFKRRKVSAIRDFPEGCGRFVPRIDLTPNVNTTNFGVDEGIVDEDKSGEDLKDGLARTSKLEDESQHAMFPTQTLRQSNVYSRKKEMSMVSSKIVDEPPLTNDETVKMGLVGLEDLELGTAEGVKCDSSKTSKDLHKNGPSSLVGEVVLLNSKFLSPNVSLADSIDCLGKSVTRRHFPQRKVSATRDFPPLCGRNAPRLGKDGCLEEISSQDKKIKGQLDLVVDDKEVKKVVASNVKEKEKNVECGDACNLVNIVQGDFEGNFMWRVNKLDELGASSDMKLLPEDSGDKHVALPDDSNHNQVLTSTPTVVEEESRDAIQLEETLGKEIVVYSGAQSLVAEPLDTSSCHHKPKRDFNELQAPSSRMVVLGLMSESTCPWRNNLGSSKSGMLGGKIGGKRKKTDFFARFDRSKVAAKSKDSPNCLGKKPVIKKKGSRAAEGMGQLVVWENKDTLDSDKNIEETSVVPRSQGFDVYVPPFGHGNLSGNDRDSNVTRNKVRETLRLFQAVTRKLLQEDEAHSKNKGNAHRRIDTIASQILKEKGKYVNTGKPILGPVPGVEVGDEFQYWVELNMIGLHRQSQGGIDSVVHNGKILATSVVSSKGYADELGSSDVLTYTGQGGSMSKNGKEPEDQKLKRGNLALKNSVTEKNPVRVIRGCVSTDGKCRRYVYDGLYEVEAYWQDMGPHGKLVYRFRMRRIPGQPELAWKEVKECKKFKKRGGLCVEDISNGKESIPICVVNTIDDEKPPPFEYTTRMIYPNWCNPIPPEGCSCTNECSDSDKCSCAVKNGGEIPYNHNGAIVEAKPLVYECSASCKCPSTCHNRVSQHGIKFQLEIFKTKTRGWGVRSLNSIPSGSFICEYIGELLEEKEAEQRTGNDEYLFDIGNLINNTLWDGLSSLIPEAQSSSCEIVENSGFTIDAAQYGNVGRFINHSCSPNLYAQNVLYDHDDKRIPHIMLFAAENIPPLQELCYDYNYMIDQVYDSDGNIKRKACFCGSAECTGRMY
ncbi:histone-lysine N-methyltransferase, H3 lysine-9 specific SUVH6-like [Prosopis cineraria]|uniref:histone-lysine N-methyltransferase, H3 lysine-9 specific SUVH6-like n=1 Tax=Prosopis cineraria TaxID=364024 RepID=UPI00240F1F34|nr:histone-lysine N-methyltransferase, H3 lysine-9 specific SUVH6-like [Prosopis cineraria]XP_054775852.1 histone-lysine N-methyltransferase, H3 lysine-9 specific SUVH6-like [Prosopis cineraria]XP_054775853.1 histone-lysine N-methyltransferase, H3 lysine-9 specific SUVH6-like [Prosopis cineraria]XP_054775854.1 histone-lysine N-methyltransferase, H3 lysine-9 specific SUVH6-like [Prosopis cineraria]